jgi:aspartyl-tRNA(Asn)/glutamyl-tRNA(Gln) amidotransferase subunit B
LEEDTGKLLHPKGADYSLVDLNRAGVPLMELVTEPDIRSGEEAAAFAGELRLLLRYLGIASADMEKGEMRVEANISLRKKGEGLGTKVEIKNLNSFRTLREAINFEINRQAEILDKGEKIRQETRGWSESGRTISQRSKEEAHDYRYLPEPDLTPLNFTDPDFINLEDLRMSLPELPAEKRERFKKEFGLDEDRLEMLIEDRPLARFFEEAVSEIFGGDGERDSGDDRIKLAFNYLSTDLKGLISLKEIDWPDLKVTPRAFAELVNLIDQGKISSRIAKDILGEMFAKGLTPTEIVANQKINLSSEEEVGRAADSVIEKNQAAVADFRKGKETALQFLVGQTMAELRGRGDPRVIMKVLREKLAE